MSAEREEMGAACGLCREPKGRESRRCVEKLEPELMCPCEKGILSERWDTSHPSSKVTKWEVVASGGS